MVLFTNPIWLACSGIVSTANRRVIGKILVAPTAVTAVSCVKVPLINTNEAPESVKFVSKHLSAEDERQISLAKMQRMTFVISY